MRLSAIVVNHRLLQYCTVFVTNDCVFARRQIRDRSSFRCEHPYWGTLQLWASGRDISELFPDRYGRWRSECTAEHDAVLHWLCSATWDRWRASSECWSQHFGRSKKPRVPNTPFLDSIRTMLKCCEASLKPRFALFNAKESTNNKSKNWTSYLFILIKTDELCCSVSRCRYVLLLNSILFADRSKGAERFEPGPSRRLPNGRK